MPAKIDTRFFNQAVRSIARSAQQPPEKVMRAEIGKVIEKTLKDSVVAKAGLIRKGHDYYALRQGVYSPKRPRRSVKVTKNGYLYYNMRDNRYPGQLWAILQETRRRSIAKLLVARGLTKGSWLDLARQLGEEIAHPGYAETAISRSGKHPENTSVSVEVGDGKIIIITNNSQPTTYNTGGERIFDAAVQGRSKYFIQQMQHAVFDDIRKIARQYPALKIAA